jgi:hypothetical protein
MPFTRLVITPYTSVISNLSRRRKAAYDHNNTAQRVHADTRIIAERRGDSELIPPVMAPQPPIGRYGQKSIGLGTGMIFMLAYASSAGINMQADMPITRRLRLPGWRTIIYTYDF